MTNELHHDDSATIGQKMYHLHLFTLDGIHTSVAGLPYTGNYNAVTTGPEPPLVMLIHTRVRQG